jgi:hypothetical protein
MAEKPKKVATKKPPKVKRRSVDELRAEFEKRPVIVDLSDGQCQLCEISTIRNAEATEQAGRPVTSCSRCGNADFTEGLHNDTTKWMRDSGFRSVKPSHYHLWIGQSSAAGKEAMWDELCLTCYRQDYMAAYPKAKKPPV